MTLGLSLFLFGAALGSFGPGFHYHCKVPEKLPK